MSPAHPSSPPRAVCIGLFAVALLHSACRPGVPERYLAIDGREGDYALSEVTIPELDDPVRMRGALGDGVVGGYLDLDSAGNFSFKGGGPIHVEYAIEDGVGVPFEQDGVILWSYYRALSSARDELDIAGVDVPDLFPVPFAYQPSVAGATLSSNAAYVLGGVHRFVVLPDGLQDGLPLAANPGVIRHELGHAVFQVIVSGGPREIPPFDDPAVSGLNEGFADMVAGFTLDDPRFLHASIDVGNSRDLAGEHDFDAAIAPNVEDPYARGIVFASYGWHLRELTDPDTALSFAAEALRVWADEERYLDGSAGVDAYAVVLTDVVLAERPGLASELCAAFDDTFDNLGPPASCP